MKENLFFIDLRTWSPFRTNRWDLSESEKFIFRFCKKLIYKFWKTDYD